MNKYHLIIAKDWRKAGMLFDIEVPEKELQSFLQKCYEKKWIILKWI